MKLPSYLWLVGLFALVGTPALAGGGAPELDAGTLTALVTGITGSYFGYRAWLASKGPK